MSTRSTSVRKAASPRRAGQGRGEPAPPAPRHFEPGRAEPPVPITDDLEERISPPLSGKAHPPGDMDEAKPSLDDESRRHRRHPHDGGTTRFGFDPDAADAAADLAGELGSTFLEGATRGQDVSERAMERDDELDGELPFLIESEEEDEAAEERAEPRRAARRR